VYDYTMLVDINGRKCSSAQDDISYQLHLKLTEIKDKSKKGGKSKHVLVVIGDRALTGESCIAGIPVLFV
jgi:hypothetical protein